MKKAIEYLRNLGFKVTDEGVILSKLPTDEKGFALVDGMEDSCMDEANEYTYTIILDKIEKIDI